MPSNFEERFDCYYSALSDYSQYKGYYDESDNLPAEIQGSIRWQPQYEVDLEPESQDPQGQSTELPYFWWQCPYCGHRLPEKPAIAVVMLGLELFVWNCCYCDAELSEHEIIYISIPFEAF